MGGLKKSGRSAACLLLSVVVLAAAATLGPQPLTAQADSAGPVASFQWSMPDRSVDANHDSFIDSYFDSADPVTVPQANACCSVPPDQIDPTSWPVDVDACASVGSDGNPIQDYAFSTAGTVLSSGAGCHQVLAFPAQGTYPVDLTVTDSTGQTNTTTSSITVKDLLVVSLGDSYGSGEGSPPYQDRRCDRSSQAASAQAAERLEQSSPHFSVTFIHLACSGARILDAHPTDLNFKGGILNPYIGQNPPSGGTIVPLNSQIDDLRALIGHRKIDFLLLSGGANDLGLIDILDACIDASFLTDPVAWALIPNCNEKVAGVGMRGIDIFEQGLATLPDHFAQLGDALNALTVTDAATGQSEPAVAPEHVYFTEYADPTRDQNGTFCDVVNSLDLPGLDQAEWRWASETVLASLNQAAAQAVAHFGWNYVGGVVNDFATHGYCSTDNWVNRLEQSVTNQHDLNGTFHPNLAGQTDIANLLTTTLLHDLANPPAPPTITFSASLVPPFEISTLGGGGWYTGECPPPGFGECLRDQVDASLVLSDKAGVAEPLGSSVSVNLDGHLVTLGAAPDYSCSLPAGLLSTCSTVVADRNSAGAITSLVVIVKLRESGVHHLAMTATNLEGRTATKSFTVPVDLQLPILNATTVQGSPGNQGWYRSPVSLTFSGSDSSPGSGLNRIDTLLLGEGPNGSAAALPTVGDPATGPVTAQLTTEGDHHISADAVDNANLRSSQALDPVGNAVGPQLTEVKIDTRPPTLQGGPDRPPDRNGWYSRDVTVRFTAADPMPGSGVDASTLTPDAVLHEGASQSVVGTVSDVAGNSRTQTVGPISIDETPPTISITAPSQGTYTLNQAVTVHYSCSDVLSGLAACAGPVLDGGSLDTSSPGRKTFTVQAMDKAGNLTSQSVSYVVAYNICPLYDQTRAVHTGAILPIKLALCDALGVDVSSSTVPVTATGLSLVSPTASGTLEDPGNSNPDNNFRFDTTLGTSGGYVYNLSTKGLTTGSYAVNFFAGSDPTQHRLNFQVR